MGLPRYGYKWVGSVLVLLAGGSVLVLLAGRLRRGLATTLLFATSCALSDGGWALKPAINQNAWTCRSSPTESSHAVHGPGHQRETDLRPDV